MPMTEMATPNTIRGKRRTNASARSASPAPRPASSVSSGSSSDTVPIFCTLLHTGGRRKRIAPRATWLCQLVVSAGGVLDGGPQAVDGERGGGRRQHPGEKRAVVLPGGEPGVHREDDQLAEPQRDERGREQVVVDALGIDEGERGGQDDGGAYRDDDPAHRPGRHRADEPAEREVFDEHDPGA